MLQTAQLLPQKGFRRWASTRPVSRPSRQPATGPPGSYPDRTSTGRRRRAYEHEETPWHYVTVSPPVLLGARENLSVSNMATATPLGPPGPDGGEAARRIAQAGRATKARLAPLAVTHRYNRTHCLWLEQFQIDALMFVKGIG